MDIPSPSTGTSPTEALDGEPMGGVEEALVEALTGEGSVGLVLLDGDLRVRRGNVAPERFHGLTIPVGSRVDALVSAADGDGLVAALRRVLETGTPLLYHPQSIPTSGNPRTRLVVSLSALRTGGTAGRPAGLVLAFADISEQERARRRLDLLFHAAKAIGDSLDVVTTARQLTAALVPELGDMAVVNLAIEVFDGDEPPQRGGADVGLRRAAISSAGVDHSAPYVPVGENLPRVPDRDIRSQYRQGEILSVPDRATMLAALGGDTWAFERLAPAGGNGFMATAIVARGLILGSIEVWRREGAEPFDDADARLFQEIASRGALSIDNARRYTREHTAAVALQRSLLPSASTDTAAARTAGFYLPTGTGSGVGGDWYDVIELSSLRVAFVVGDVVGHGLRATALMGRLSTAVQTLADLELPPDELLAHLDDIVLRLTANSDETHDDMPAATCVYAVYEPVTGRLAMASAGHPPPALVRPDGTVEFVEVVPGPPLGVGGMPFELTEIDVPPGSTLAFYTDGLVECGGDITAGMEALRRGLVPLHDPARDLDEAAHKLVAKIGPANPSDDIALLLARVRTVASRDVASWEIPADPAAVAGARERVTRQLTAWGLEDAAFTTELVASELVTNAIRYAGGPVVLRLIRDKVLVCEVSDPSNTQPRLRRAKWSDEGGRGLFLVAQLTTRWGSRYGPTGKTIWTEQPLGGIMP
ncbi:SpoIIE family protein phosphatase (plasmid) [Embleya sp. NBC_00888]|uniref:ATP-binding SpoIIE family protein phosphatase n=1 Tax=Embleya sp. NBC_00888 TaxID=2975960 RepID=UPI002F916A68|nr:SpoIIE family protein phosphatase [Embleya sp. NBC_00888]